MDEILCIKKINYRADTLPQQTMVKPAFHMETVQINHAKYVVQWVVEEQSTSKSPLKKDNDQ